MRLFPAKLIIDFCVVFDESALAERLRFWGELPMRIVLLVLFFSLAPIACRDQSPEAVEKRILNSETLGRVNEWCNDFPKPDDFEFIRKIDSGNAFTVSISYLFRSSMSFGEVQKFYEYHLTTMGWVKTGSSGYEKDGRKVVIGPSQIQGARYSIYCAELH